MLTNARFALMVIWLITFTIAHKVTADNCCKKSTTIPQVPHHNCPCNTNNAGTLRYYDNKIQFCNGLRYVDIGKEIKPLGTQENPAKTCADILKENGRKAESGIYYLKQGQTVVKAYCFMEKMCGSKGWTMIMKIDGKKTTFSYNSKYWTNRETYNLAGADGGLDNKETKLKTYSTLPFSKLCLGLKTAGVTRWMTVGYRASSLYSLIADGKFRQTYKGRDAWKNLIRGSSLQRNCNREGFNVNPNGHTRARIGIVSNQENDCKSPDSRIGFGTAGSYCGQNDKNSAGNEARCFADNGDKSIKSFGYIFAQEEIKNAPLGSLDKPASSCLQIRSQMRAKSGVYYLKQGHTVIKAYCYMGQICGSRGWTMIMKIDGSKPTFSYNSKYWTKNETFNLAGADGGLDNKETKLDTYSHSPFSKLCLGLKTAGLTRWMTLIYRANSLYSLIADGKYRPTRYGRNAWKNLISGSSLQRNCNREGFNVNPNGNTKARIGIVSNQENDCKSPDSRIGFGTAGSYCGQNDKNSAGNEARCSPDNGDKSIKSFGYIFVQ